MRYLTFLGRRHNSRRTHSPQTRSRNKMAVFSSYFRDFVGAQKIEDLTESKQFFAEVFQITSSFVLAKKKKLGVGCTLTFFRPPLSWFLVIKVTNSKLTNRSTDTPTDRPTYQPPPDQPTNNQPFSQ